MIFTEFLESFIHDYAFSFIFPCFFLHLFLSYIPKSKYIFHLHADRPLTDLLRFFIMPNLCVSCTFNPPVITVLGSTLREDTVRAMEQQIPLATSTASNPGKEPVKFAFLSNPDHWRLELPQHFCDDLHKSAMALAIISSLEQEGWRIRAAVSVSHADACKEASKMFFTRA